MQKKRIFKILDKFEKKLINYYIDNGPEKLRNKLEIESDQIWMNVFDYLVFEMDVIKKCIRKNPDYIHDLFSKKGPKIIRKAFKIDEDKYDLVWEYVIDYIGISRGALYEFVVNNIDVYNKLILGGKASKIRDDLLISDSKYDNVWEEVLDLLLECVATERFSYSTYENGLRMFMRFYNSGRKHRSLNKRLTEEELDFLKEKDKLEDED